MDRLQAYRCYRGSMRYSEEDAIYHGRVEGLRDLVTYEGADPKALERAFRTAVDDYIDLCAERDMLPTQKD